MTSNSASALLLTVLVSGLTIAVIIAAYLKREFARQSRRHGERCRGWWDSAKYQALNSDQKATFDGYVLRSVNRADRKRLVFQTVYNVLSLVAGVLPLMVVLIDTEGVQKMLAVIVSVVVTIDRSFKLADFTIEHRRAGYLIEAEITGWLAAVGDYDGHTDDEQFKQLIKSVRRILDTSESSFIGAGTEEKKPVEPLWNPEASKAALDDFDAIGFDNSMSPPEYIPDEVPRRLPNVPEPVLSSVAIAPESFGAWQAEQLAKAKAAAEDDDDYAEVTQI